TRSFRTTFPAKTWFTLRSSSGTRPHLASLAGELERDGTLLGQDRAAFGILHLNHQYTAGLIGLEKEGYRIVFPLFQGDFLGTGIVAVLGGLGVADKLTVRHEFQPHPASRRAKEGACVEHGHHEEPIGNPGWIQANVEHVAGERLLRCRHAESKDWHHQ